MAIPIKRRSWKKAKKLMEETYQEGLANRRDYAEMINSIREFDDIKWLTLFDVDELIMRHKKALKVLNKLRDNITDYNGLFVEYQEKRKRRKNNE